MDLFRRVFGLPRHEEQGSRDKGPRPYYEEQHPEDEQDFDRFYSNPPEEPVHGFDVFTDPLQMHQYFEQQMGEMLKSFGFQGFGTFVPGMERRSSSDKGVGTFNPVDDSENIREHFLKKGYEKPSLPADRQDKDVDGKFNVGEIESILKGKSQTVVPHNRNNWGPGNFSFGQSISSKTIRNSDGSMETHKTVRDNTGNEETTITRRSGDKEYTITKRRTKDGKEEIIENFVNMDEQERDKLLKPYNTPSLHDSPSPSYRFPFDRFFK